jgi:hypothetical protein
MESIKYILIILMAGFFSVSNSLATPPDTLQINNNNQDEQEFELVIFDPYFHSWFSRESLPASHYTQEYLENWNRILVNQWNSDVPGPRRAQCMTDTYINYRSDVDYGMELNHQLFYFFRYIHERCRIFSNTPGRW